ncbi:hypothetical protein [Merismopedia glauca]|uniref:Uncharacterized protein n=1 Tax=Merismopedia glauca CCAP 1448/3 TaxID=1296344 RepID=A0A2T1BZD1_9CYAN|nr:hypothetical protein [Merismopedia glauca]PSB01385.1 hypothetical protein C7B64_18525 [Merismopedia glauca CCAP 1448/3]
MTYCDISDQIEQWQESTQSCNPKAAYALAELIQQISEDRYSASWLMGIEDGLKRSVESDNADGWLTDDEYERLKQLKQECGGWWHWGEADLHPVFVPENPDSDL